MGRGFSGKARLQKKMQAIPRAIIEEVQQAMASGANQIVAAQKRLVPVNTGRLRDSIGWHWGTAHRVKFSQGAKIASGPFGLTITAGNSKVRYAHLVEFGTSPHTVGGRFKGAQHPGTSAQGFFLPGYRIEQKKVRLKLRRAMRSGARKAIRQTGG